MSTAFKDISYDLIKGIYTQLNSSVYQRCDTITLSGTSGTALITNNGVSKTITFSGTLVATAAAFVATNAAAYLAAGTVLTSSGATLIFTASVLGASFIGATTIVTTYNGFLPSKDELNAMYTELHLYGLGNFANNIYWTSSEISSNNVYDQYFLNGNLAQVSKINKYYVRACFAFPGNSTDYPLRSTGQGGGLVFAYAGGLVLEATLTDQSILQQWSNIITPVIGASAQGTAIGTGQANTLAIIGQAGHTDSAAKLCNDLVITGGTGISGTVTNADLTFGLTYPVYKSIPKPAATTYIYIGNVINDTDGTKDEFHYNGTCQIQVIDESKQRADSKLALNILNVIRGILKPTRGAVFSISPSTLVVFEPGPYNEVIEENNGVTKIKLIDIYNFLIT